MDYTYNYTFTEYENGPIWDEKLHLGRRLIALLLCAVFVFPFVYYNIPRGLHTLKTEDILSVSENADFTYNLSRLNDTVSFRANLLSGELQFFPTIDYLHSIQIIIATKNTIITGADSNFSLLSYVGNDGLNYTHIVCKEGYLTLSLFDEKESKVSATGRTLRPGYEAVVFNDETRNITDFVRFESDGTDPKPGHGIYTRPVSEESGLFEYIEIEPINYDAFLISEKYKAPIFSYPVDLELNTSGDLSDDTAEDANNIPTDTALLPITRDDMYFSEKHSIGTEESVLESAGEDTKENSKENPEKISEENIENSAVTKPVISAIPVAETFSNNIAFDNSLVINDNIKTLGSPDTPLYLDTLTIHENFPSNTVTIIGTVHVNNLILIASYGKQESDRIKTGPDNSVLPMKNYFKLAENSALIIS